MKIFSRLSQLVKSNLNAALDRMTDPAKEIDHLVEEMEEELRKSRIELRNQLAQVKLQEKRVEECQRNIYRFQDHARRAVQAGEDELAKEALRRLQDAEQKLTEAERFREEQSNLGSKMAENIRQNDQKLNQIKLRKETLKAQAKIHKQSLSSQGTAFDRFDQLASQIELNEHQAEAMVEMAQMNQEDKDRSSSERFDRMLGGTNQHQDQELEYRLQALKASLGQDKKLE